ncbi:MAG: flavodoxin family protein [Candidatus Brocadiia bacterium]
MKQTVVAYYSRTGGTAKVAGQLAAILDADLEEIREAKDRSGVLGLLSAAWDSTLKREATLTSKHSAEGRKTIVIATPIWGFRPPPALRSYLKKVNLAGKKVCAVSTFFGLGGDRVLDAIAAMVPGGLSARLPLKRPAAQSNLAATLKEWAKKVGG